jgi:hypothetical protein
VPRPHEKKARACDINAGIDYNWGSAGSV